MTSGDTHATNGFEMRDDFIAEAVAPLDAYLPMGKDDGIAQILYRRAQIEGTAQVLIDFLDLAKDYISDEPIHSSEENELRTSRIIAIVADIPATIPARERLRVWRKLLATDKIVAGSPFARLEKVVRALAQEDPEFGAALIAVMQQSAGDKAATINQALFDNDEPTISLDEFDYTVAMRLDKLVEEKNLDISQVIGASVVLSYALRALK